MAFGSKQCDHELGNEWVHFSDKNASYITIKIIITLKLLS